MSQEFHCTFCNSVVEEDQSALPKKDSRLLLAKYNEQLEPLYILLREVEGIKLSPEILEPEPTDINTIRGLVLCTHLQYKSLFIIIICILFNVKQLFYFYFSLLVSLIRYYQSLGSKIKAFEMKNKSVINLWFHRR